MLATLQADAGVGLLLGNPLRVVEAGAPKPAYPYLEIVRHERAFRGGAGFEAGLHQIDLRTVSRDSGGMAAREAMAAVSEALAVVFGPGPVDLGEWRCVLMTPVFGDFVQMRDGLWRALLRMKAIVEPA